MQGGRFISPVKEVRHIEHFAFKASNFARFDRVRRANVAVTKTAPQNSALLVLLALLHPAGDA
jgi:hypothetical protein